MNKEIIEEVRSYLISEKIVMVEPNIFGAFVEFVENDRKKQLAIQGVGCSLPSKDAVSSYIKEYTKQEMTEFKPDELICFTSGVLKLHTWLSESKIK